MRRKKVVRYTFTATPEQGAELTFLVVHQHWLAYEESLAATQIVCVSVLSTRLVLSRCSSRARIRQRACIALIREKGHLSGLACGLWPINVVTLDVKHYKSNYYVTYIYRTVWVVLTFRCNYFALSSALLSSHAITRCDVVSKMAVLWKTVALALSFTVALGTKYKEGDKVENWVLFFLFLEFCYQKNRYF